MIMTMLTTVCTLAKWMKEIKGFISARGVQVSTYRKPELIQLKQWLV